MGHIKFKEKVFLEILQNSQEKTCAKVFFNKVAGLRLVTLLKKTLAQVLFCEFCEISKNTFFTEHLRWLLLDIRCTVASQVITIIPAVY